MGSPHWGLEQDWGAIQQKPVMEWKREVALAAEKRNIVKLREECETLCRGEATKKKKTRFVLENLDLPDYKRKPDSFIMHHNYILHSRALIMGRYGMLKCASNFRNGFGTDKCDKCNVVDDESHRINHCKKWQNINRFEDSEKIIFTDIFSNDTKKCFAVVQVILSVWDLGNGKNEMRQTM